MYATALILAPEDRAGVENIPFELQFYEEETPAL